MRLNVRCCCNYSKVLGTLLVPDGYGPGARVRIQLLVPMRFPLPTTPVVSADDSAVIELKEVYVGSRIELAVYADDRPIEFWRRCPWFREGDRL